MTPRYVDVPVAGVSRRVLVVEPPGRASGIVVCLHGSRSDPATMWVDEEGKLTTEPQRNWKADVLCPMAWGDWTAGDVAFSGGVGPQGETLALTPAQVQKLRRVDRDVHVILLDERTQEGI